MTTFADFHAQDLMDDSPFGRELAAAWRYIASGGGSGVTEVWFTKGPGEKVHDASREQQPQPVFRYSLSAFGIRLILEKVRVLR